MNISAFTVALALAFLLPASAALAETRYITDQLLVTVRSDTSKDFKSLENLQTDTPVEVLKVEGAFVQVKTAKGNTGYIPSQYVSKNIPKPIQISKLTQQVTALQAQLEKERQEYQKNSAAANSEQRNIAAITSELQQTKLELEKISSDYKTLRESSEDVLNLMTTAETLTEENYRLSNELAVLQKENNNFHRSNMVQWFLAGGGVFFFGWLIGKISRRKRGFERF
jgi:SH3 domain protein